MQIVLPVNPTYVNVLTDLFLVLLQTVWQYAMRTLTTADIRRTLRLRAPFPTYEQLGTWKYLMELFSNYERLKASLASDDKRWFQWSILKGLVAFLITVGMVGLHFVIDLGLENGIEYSHSTEYDSVGLRSRPEYLEVLDDYHAINSVGLASVRERCERERLTAWECRQLARFQESSLTSRLQEGVSFLNLLYSDSFLATVDVLDELTFDYATVNISAPDALELTECTVEEDPDVKGRARPWRLSHSDCGLSDARLKGVIIGMQARAVLHRSVLDTSKSCDIPFVEEFLSFENYKADHVIMPSTNSSVHTLKVPDIEQQPNRPVKRARLTVDGGLRQGAVGQERINITVLASNGEKRIFKPVFWRSDPVEIAHDAPDDQRCAGTPYSTTVFKNVKTVYNGKFGRESCEQNVSMFVEECSQRWVNRHFSYYCSRLSRHQIYQPYWDGTRIGNVYCDICGAMAIEEFFPNEYFPESWDYQIKYLYLGVPRMESVCAVRETIDGRYEKMCAMGAEYLRWDGREWSAIAENDADEWTVHLDLNSTLAFVEITGKVFDSMPSGNWSDILENVWDAMENTAAILSMHGLWALRKFTSDSTSQKRIFGVSTVEVHDLLLAMMTQVGNTSRSVYITPEVAQTSVLDGKYVYTMIAFIAVTCMATLISLLREAEEFRLSLNSESATRRIPLRTTDWVEFLLQPLNKGGADDIEHCATHRYEYTSRVEKTDLEEKGSREEDDTPATGKLGFFEGPEPLRAGVDYK